MNDKKDKNDSLKNGSVDSIVFYCKDCEEIVETNRVGSKYVYKCKKCGTKNVAFGTKKSIYTFFRLDDKEENEEVNKEKVEVKKGEAKAGEVKKDKNEGGDENGGEQKGEKK